MIPTYEIVMSLALVGCIYQAKKFNDMKKHDQHLYAFCQLRREVIGCLYGNMGDISRDEYIALRKVLSVLNSTIRNYKTHKVVLFNFRLFKKHMERTKNISIKMDEIETKNEQIKKFQKHFVNLMFHGFIEYTPFLKSEVIARLIIAILSGVAKITGKKMAVYADSIREAINYSNKYQMAQFES